MSRSANPSSSPTSSSGLRPARCTLCAGAELELVFQYDAAPEGETVFDLRGQPYEREVWRCATCGHFLNAHRLDLGELYGGTYVDATYGDGLAAAFERVMTLPPERSDNAQRVARVLADLGTSGSLLDIGSGLGVFPARMAAAGWTVTALDPDPRAVEHLRTYVGVDAVCADFMTAGDLGSFDLVALNKVLEHVVDPIAMLQRARTFLREGGSVYVEVPDGELATADGAGREEFFVEHVCAFSMTSLNLVLDRAGLVARRLERIHDPSGKYTLTGFLS